MTIAEYRTRDRVADYHFSFEQHGSVWRAIILRQPSYGTRPCGAHESHRLTLSDGRRYVCWTPEPTTLDACREVARTWADCTQHYLATGTFGAPGSLRRSPPPITGDGVVGYRSLDRTGVYLFRLVAPAGFRGWRANILRQPNHAGRPADAATTGRARTGMSWRVDGEWRTREAAAQGAARWAEANQAYLATGRPPARVRTPSPLARIRGRIG